jgi:hypothetical protein
MPETEVICPDTKERNQPVGIIEEKWEMAGEKVGSKLYQ